MKTKKKKKQISLNDFHIISRLGTGAFGTVYRIKSKLDKKEYALKVINKNTIIEKKYFNYIIPQNEDKNEKDNNNINNNKNDDEKKNKDKEEDNENESNNENKKKENKNANEKN